MKFLEVPIFNYISNFTNFFSFYIGENRYFIMHFQPFFF